MKSHRLIAVLVTALVVLSACGEASPPTSTSPSAAAKASAPASGSAAASAAPAGSRAYVPQPLTPAVKIKLSTVGVAAEGPMFLAIDRGYFKEEGLDLEEQYVGVSTSQHLALLLAGQTDFSDASVNAGVFNAAARGVGVKMIAPIITNDKTDKSGGLVIRQDLIDSGAYKDIKDLKGKKIAVPGEASPSHWQLQRVLGTGGLSIQDVTFVPLNFPDMLPALGNKAIEAGWLPEPFTSIAKTNKIGSLVFTYGQASPGYSPGVLLVGPSMSSQPEVIKRVVIALARGARAYHTIIDLNQGPKDEVIASLVKHTTVKDPKQYEAIGGWSTADPNMTLDLSLWGSLQDFFIQSGSQQQKVDLAQVIDTSYIDNAIQRLGRA